MRLIDRLIASKVWFLVIIFCLVVVVVVIVWRYTIDWSTSLSAARFFPVSRVTCKQLTFDKIDGVTAVPCCCDGCAMVALDVNEANDGAVYTHATQRIHGFCFRFQVCIRPPVRIHTAEAFMMRAKFGFCVFGGEKNERTHTASIIYRAPLWPRIKIVRAPPKYIYMPLANSWPFRNFAMNIWRWPNRCVYFVCVNLVNKFRCLRVSVCIFSQKHSTVGARWWGREQRGDKKKRKRARAHSRKW